MKLHALRSMSASVLNSTRLRQTAVVAVTGAGALALAGCGPGAGIGAGALLLLAWPLAHSAWAGPQMPCPKPGLELCRNGIIVTPCCSYNDDPEACGPNAVAEPFVTCGQNTCVPGRDPGRCAPAPNGWLHGREIKGPDDCKANHGAWAKACVDRQVSDICIPPMPTNYGGPPAVASWHACGTDRCTTYRLPEDCFPGRSEAVNFPLWFQTTHCIGPTGFGVWREICLHGAVEQRCIPLAPSAGASVGAVAKTGGAQAFVTCPDGSCAVGRDDSVCPK